MVTHFFPGTQKYPEYYSQTLRRGRWSWSVLKYSPGKLNNFQRVFCWYLLYILWNVQKCENSLVPWSNFINFWYKYPYKIKSKRDIEKILFEKFLFFISFILRYCLILKPLSVSGNKKLKFNIQRVLGKNSDTMET